MTQLDQERLGELLSAYLDGELDAERAVSIERLVAEDPQARRLLDELRETAQCVSRLPRHGAPDSVLDDIQLRLERAQLLEEPQAGPSGPHRHRSGLWQWVSIAAAVGISVLGGTWALVGGRQAPLRIGEEIVAQGPIRGEPGGGKGPAMPQGTNRVRQDVGEESSKRQVAPSDRKGETSDDTARLDTLSKTGPEFDVRSALRQRRDQASPLAQPGGRPTSVAYRTSTIGELGEGDTDSTLHLKLTAADEQRRQHVLASLTSTLDSYIIEEAASERATARRRDSVSRISVHRGTVAGDADVAGPHRVIARVPVARVDALIAEMGVQYRDEYVTLSAGPLVFEGWRRTRFALGGVNRSARDIGAGVGGVESQMAGPSPDSRPESGERFAGGEDPTKRSSWLDLALDAMGVTDDRGPQSVADLADAGEPTTGDARAGDESKRAAEMEPLEESARAAKPTGKDAGRVAEAAPATTWASSEKALGERAIATNEPKLVERRMKELQAREAAEAGPGAGRDGSASSLRREQQTEGDRYVTLVIEVDVRTSPPRRLITPSRTPRPLREPASPDKPHR